MCNCVHWEKWSVTPIAYIRDALLVLRGLPCAELQELLASTAFIFVDLPCCVVEEFWQPALQAAAAICHGVPETVAADEVLMEGGSEESSAAVPISAQTEMEAGPSAPRAADLQDVFGTQCTEPGLTARSPLNFEPVVASIRACQARVSEHDLEKAAR